MEESPDIENLDQNFIKDQAAKLTVDPREKTARSIKIVAGVASIILSLVSIAAITNQSSNSILNVQDILDSYDSTIVPDSTSDSSWDLSWVPSGYTAWAEDSNLAWKWGANNNCTDYGCVTAQFISRDGCPQSFYAAVNWLDGNDSVVSYANATLPSLNAMQSAKLNFDDIEGTSKSAQMASISCF